LEDGGESIQFEYLTAQDILTLSKMKKQ
jgi:hypothetical protein